MKVSEKGRARLNAVVRRHLDEVNAGVPRDGVQALLVYWIVGLLENADNPALKKDLEEP